MAALNSTVIAPKSRCRGPTITELRMEERRVEESRRRTAKVIADKVWPKPAKRRRFKVNGTCTTCGKVDWDYTYFNAATIIQVLL